MAFCFKCKVCQAVFPGKEIQQFVEHKKKHLSDSQAVALTSGQGQGPSKSPGKPTATNDAPMGTENSSERPTMPSEIYWTATMDQNTIEGQEENDSLHSDTSTLTIAMDRAHDSDTVSATSETAVEPPAGEPGESSSSPIEPIPAIQKPRTKYWLSNLQAKQKDGGFYLKCSQCGKGFKTGYYLKRHKARHASHASSTFRNDTSPRLSIAKSSDETKRVRVRPGLDFQRKSKPDPSGNQRKPKPDPHGNQWKPKPDSRGDQWKPKPDPRGNQRKPEPDSLGNQRKSLLNCPICAREVSGKLGLDSHLKSDHPNSKTYRCLECPFASNTDALLKRHEVLHRTPNIFDCGYCSASFGNRSSREQHVQSVHPGNNLEIPLRPIVRRKAATHEEGYYKKQEEIQTAAMVHNINLVRQADRDKHLNASEAEGRKHKARDHSQESKRYPCPECPYVAPGSCKLAEHFRIHTNNNPIKCDLCTATFLKGNTKSAHMKAIHQVEVAKPLSHRTPEKVVQRRSSIVIHKCELCDFCSLSPSSVKCHAKSVHLSPSQNWKVECPICFAKFERKSNMSFHINKFHYSRKLDYSRGPVSLDKVLDDTQVEKTDKDGCQGRVRRSLDKALDDAEAQFQKMDDMNGSTEPLEEYPLLVSTPVKVAGDVVVTQQGNAAGLFITATRDSSK